MNPQFCRFYNFVRQWFEKSLASEAKEWEKDDEPMVDEEGYFGTDLPIILHQMLSEILSVAKKISIELKDEVFNVIVEEMKSFSKSFIKELTEFQRKVRIIFILIRLRDFRETNLKRLSQVFS